MEIITAVGFHIKQRRRDGTWGISKAIVMPSVQCKMDQTLKLTSGFSTEPSCFPLAGSSNSTPDVISTLRSGTGERGDGYSTGYDASTSGLFFDSLGERERERRVTSFYMIVPISLVHQMKHVVINVDLTDPPDA